MLADVREFLELCKPRLVTLIEAGIEGRLDDKTLERCLQVRERVVGESENGVPQALKLGSDR